MGNIVKTLALPGYKLTYDKTLPYLRFIKTYYGDIPVVHYHVSDKLNTLLISHANATDVGEFNVKKLSKQFNTNIVVYDYCGYGLHGCRHASEEHCYQDIEYVYNDVIKHGVPPESIILYGRSIGTGVASHMAQWLCQHNMPTKLILVSPFKSVIRVMINIPHLPVDMFNIESMAHDITCPVMFIHGCQDKITDYQQSCSLSKQFCNVSQFVTIHGCGHHELPTRSEYVKAIRSFCKIT